MSNQPRKLEYLDGEIPCMLLPMQEAILLLPTVTIAEMAPMKPVTEAADKPDWYLGAYEWRDTVIPLVSYERLNGASSHELNKEGRIAVVNNTGVSQKKLPFFAIATQNIPRMARIGNKDIQVDERSELDPYDTMRVMIGVERLTIPNIQKIENTLTELL